MVARRSMKAPDRPSCNTPGNHEMHIGVSGYISVNKY